MRVIVRAKASNDQMVATVVIVIVKVLDIMKKMDELLIKINSSIDCYCCCIAWVSLIVVTAE